MKTTPGDRNNLEKLETRIGYRFQDRAWLIEALTHRSFASEQPYGTCRHNERLEFLGDAVIGFIVSEWLDERFPDAAEGVLAKFKSHLVGSIHLAEIARGIGLGEFLRLNRGEEKTGGRAKRALLENAFEALTAAMYRDGGMAEATRFIRTEFAASMDELDPLEVTLADAKTGLQDWLRANRLPLPEYHTVSADGPPHQRQFFVTLSINDRIISEGSGPSVKAAHQSAAAIALERLKQGLSVTDLT
jgi:ribonuclease-3